MASATLAPVAAAINLVNQTAFCGPLFEPGKCAARGAGLAQLDSIVRVRGIPRGSSLVVTLQVIKSESVSPGGPPMPATTPLFILPWANTASDSSVGVDGDGADLGMSCPVSVCAGDRLECVYTIDDSAVAVEDAAAADRVLKSYLHPDVGRIVRSLLTVNPSVSVDMTVLRLWNPSVYV